MGAVQTKTKPPRKKTATRPLSASTSVDARKDAKQQRSLLPTARESIFTRLDSMELRRRFWHMSPGLLPFLMWPIPHRDPISPTLYVIIVAIVVGLSLKIFLQYRLIQRVGETNGTSGVVGYAAAIVGTALLFPAHVELAMTVLAILAFGDGSATLGGLLFRGPKLPWNHEKSWSGSICFLMVGVPMAAIVYWGETHNLEAQTAGVSFATALICAGPAVLMAAIAESLPVRLNDNIRVGVTSAVTLAVVHGLVVGL